MPLNLSFVRKTWFIVTLSILTVFITVGIILDHHFEGIVQTQLKEALNKNPQRLYNIKFKKLNLQMVRGNISISGIGIAPRPEILDSLQQIGIHQSLLASLQVKKIDLKGINLLELLTGEAISLKNISIKKPQIDIRFTGYKKAVKDTIDPYESIYKIAQDLHSSEVQSVNLENAQLRLINPKNDTTLKVYGLGVKLSSFKVDTHQLHLPINLRELVVNADSVWSQAGKNHNIEVRGIQCSFKDSSVSATSFKLLPKKSKEEFSAALPYQQTWHNIACGTIHISEIDFEKLLFDKELQIGQIEINEPVAHLYKDKRPKWPYFKSHEIPSALVRKIPLKTTIGAVKIKDGHLKFEQKQNDRSDLGTLLFSSMNIEVSNITNRTEALQKDKYAHLEGTMKFMNSGIINARMKFDLVSKADYWSVWAKMGKMPMEKLNDFLFPVANVKISGGTIHHALLNMNCNRLTAQGTLDLDYDNARINIMKYDEATNAMSGQKFISFIANGVIRTSNRRDSPHFRQGKIDYTRAMDHPYFRFLWSAIQDGLVDTFVGVGDKEKRRQKQKEKGSSPLKFPKISIKNRK